MPQPVVATLILVLVLIAWTTREPERPATIAQAASVQEPLSRAAAPPTGGGPAPVAVGAIADASTGDTRTLR